MFLWKFLTTALGSSAETTSESLEMQKWLQSLRRSVLVLPMSCCNRRTNRRVQGFVCNSSSIAPPQTFERKSNALEQPFKCLKQLSGTIQSSQHQISLALLTLQFSSLSEPSLFPFSFKPVTSGNSRAMSPGAWESVIESSDFVNARYKWRSWWKFIQFSTDLNPWKTTTSSCWER